MSGMLSQQNNPPDMMNAMKEIVIAAFLLLFPWNMLHADAYTNVEVKKLLVSTKTGNGDPVAYLNTANPEVTALEVTFPPGGSTGWHKHPVPVYAYVLEGTLTVKLESGQCLTFNKGDAIFEVMNTFHNGTNLGKEPVRLVVFYTGAEGVPNVIRQEQPEPAHAGN
jgi:quercetin dioxygenase-like cupin family protein